MPNYFDTSTGKLIDVPEKGGTIKRTDDMVPAERSDLKLGQLVYITNDVNPDKVLPHIIRGKIQCDRKMRFTNEKDEDEWLFVEPDWSYNTYRKTMEHLLKTGCLLIVRPKQ